MDGEVRCEEYSPAPKKEGHHVRNSKSAKEWTVFPHRFVFSLKKVFHWIAITPDSFLSLETNILFLCLKNLSEGFQLCAGWESLTLSIKLLA